MKNFVLMCGIFSAVSSTLAIVVQDQTAPLLNNKNKNEGFKSRIFSIGAIDIDSSYLVPKKNLNSYARKSPPRIEKRVSYAFPPNEMFRTKVFADKKHDSISPNRKQDFGSIGNDFYSYKPSGADSRASFENDFLDDEGSDDKILISSGPIFEISEPEMDQSFESGNQKIPYFDTSADEDDRQEASPEYDDEKSEEELEDLSA